MIGIFGVFNRDAGRRADSQPLANQVSGRYSIRIADAGGASIGMASHQDRATVARHDLPEHKVYGVACGSVFNLTAFAQAGQSPTDAAELVVQLYCDNQLSRLASVNGQFAAAVYDQARHRLVLITDRLATFPIHIWSDDGSIVFSSHLYTMLGEPRVKRRANPQALRQIFTMQRTIGGTAPLAGIQALPAGIIAEFDGHRQDQRSYWSLKWQKPSFTPAEGAEQLSLALRSAVKRQRASDGNGLLLSGGIDSRLILLAAEQPPTCWTTASYENNPELAIARRIAGLAQAPHRALIVDPEETLRVLDETVRDSDGLYPASTSMSVFLPEVGHACRRIFTGHGLDYTLRGYYLPTHIAKFGGSRTRLPILRGIPRQPTGADVLHNLRQGPPRQTVERIVARGNTAGWWHDVETTMQDALEPWLRSEQPYNAWDAFILHAVSRHYAFTSMTAVRAVADLAMPAFDNEVFETYLQMPPAWRCSGRMVQRALQHLSPAGAAIPNANTGFRADLAPWLEIGGLYGRAAMRRLGLARRPETPTQSHSAGSWQNLDALYRLDPSHRTRFLEIRGRLDALVFGVLDADGIAACIDEHLAGTRAHGKLLRQLLTHDAWVRVFGIHGHA